MKDKKYVERIIFYCTKIKNYLGTIKNNDEFVENPEKVDAVLLNLEQIGETAKKLSETFKNSNKNIQWTSIIGLRNLISHEYEGIDPVVIYNTATKNIPVLLNTLLSTQF